MKVEPKVELDIDGTTLLIQLLKDSFRKKDTLHCLFLLRENREFIEPHNLELMEWIKDICHQILFDTAIEELKGKSTENYSKQISLILDFMLGEGNDELKIQKRIITIKVEQQIL